MAITLPLKAGSVVSREVYRCMMRRLMQAETLRMLMGRRVEQVGSRTTKMPENPVGRLVLLPMRETERKRLHRLAGANKMMAHWTEPFRVVSQEDGTLTCTSIWSTEKDRKVHVDQFNGYRK